jgi:hypothetical protein
MTAVGVYYLTLTGRVRHLATVNGEQVSAMCGQALELLADRVAGADALPVCRRCTARSRPGELRA